MTGPWNAAVHTTKMFSTEKKYLFFNPHFWLSFKVDLSAPLLLSRNREPDTRPGPVGSPKLACSKCQRKFAVIFTIF